MNSQATYNIKTNTCRGCSLHYDYLYRNEILAGRVPLILHCKHTLCADCIKANIRDNSVVCPECETPSIIPSSSSKKLQEIFPVNFFLLGLIYYTKPFSKGGSDKFKPSGTRLMSKGHNFGFVGSISVAGDMKEECSQQDCKFTATMRCAECVERYCDKCCETVHKIARGFRSHKISPITLAAVGEVREVCPFHPNGMKEFHCVMCDNDACAYCMMEVHSGHQYYRLNELSEADRSQFSDLIEAAQLILKQLHTTGKIVEWNLKQNKITHNVCSTEITIARYFAELHGRLQLAERKLVNDMMVAKNFNFYKLSCINDELGATISTLNTCINTAKSLLTSNDHKVNVKSLKEQLTNCLNIPCYLVGQKQTSNVINFTPNDIFDNLEQLFTVEADTENEYRLVSQSELPDDYKPCELPEAAESVCSVRSVTCSSPDTVVDGSAKVSSRTSSNSGREHRRKWSTSSNVSDGASQEFSIGSWIASLSRKESASSSGGKSAEAPWENVEVFHINSPESFYVQFMKSKGRLNKLTVDISSYVKNLATVVHDPQLNEMYAVKYEIKPPNSYQWCRGRVTDIAMDKNGKEFLYKILYVDFGNTQRVRQQMLRQIPAELANIEPLAVHCKIYDIYPRRENKWERGAMSLMTQILNGSDNVVLYPNSVANDVIEVDLLAFSNESDPSSVRDALLFTGFGVPHITSEPQAQQRAKWETAKLFKNDHKLKTNQEFVVSVSHVCSPELFYVQIVEHLPQLDKLMKNMQKFYKNKKKGFVYNPKKEMNVVVMFEDLSDPTNDNWYRAEIVDIVAGKGTVKVFLVDYGATVNVLWTNVRKLQLQFTNIECQAIGVKLADVEPLDQNKGWPQSAVVTLQNYMFSKEKLRMVVSSEAKPLEVVLFEVYEAADVCVNAQLVDSQQAKSTGTLSEQLNWPKQVEQADDLEKSLRSVTRIEVDDEVHEKALKISVEILHAVSPDEIYARFDNETFKHEMHDLEDGLQDYYSSLSEKLPKKEFNPNDHCVVFCDNSNQYLRAKIIKVVSENDVNVFLKDKATSLVVPKLKVYESDGKFDHYPPIAIKCRLSGIKPAGDPNKWSLTAVEFLQDLFQNHTKISITKTGSIDPETDLLPAIMWYSEFIPGGPLEPSRTKVHSISKLLVSQGLALRCQNQAQTVVENAKLRENASCSRVSSGPSVVQSTPSASSTVESASSVVESAARFSKAAKPGADWNELVEKELGMYKNDYPPAWTVKTKRFSGCVTFIDLDATISVQLCGQEVAFIEMVDQMKKVFDQLPPDDPQTSFLPGELCTVFYHETERWYRGKVMRREEDDGFYRVLMVDFGNEERCSITDMRKKVMYQDVPSMAYKIRLHKVYAKNNRWITSDVDRLHGVFATGCITMVIKGLQFRGTPTEAEVFTEDGKNINDFIVKSSGNLSRSPFATRGDDSDSDDDVIVIEETVERRTDGEVAYVFAETPQITVGAEMEVALISVLDLDKVVVEIPNESVDNEVFVRISLEMQECAERQPVMRNFVVGQPCIAQFSEDLLWYRGQIEDVLEDGSVSVWFVDFGNLEVMERSKIRVIKEDWLNYPLQHYPAAIANVELAEPSNLNRVIEFLGKYTATMQHVTVENVEPLELSFTDKNTKKYLYEELINEGIIVLKD